MNRRATHGKVAPLSAMFRPRPASASTVTHAALVMVRPKTSLRRPVKGCVSEVFLSAETPAQKQMVVSAAITKPLPTESSPHLSRARSPCARSVGRPGRKTIGSILLQSAEKFAKDVFKGDRSPSAVRGFTGESVAGEPAVLDGLALETIHQPLLEESPGLPRV